MYDSPKCVWGGLCSVITGIGNGCDRAQPSICKTVLDRTVSATAGCLCGQILSKVSEWVVLSRPVSPKLAHEAVLAKPPYFDETSAQWVSKMRGKGVQNVKKVTGEW